jgi:hypothetical protein
MLPEATKIPGYIEGSTAENLLAIREPVKKYFADDKRTRYAVKLFRLLG